MSRGKIDRVESAATETLQHDAPRELIAHDEVRVKIVEQRHRLRAAVQILRVHVRHVPAECEQGEIGLRFVAKKLGPPDPRSSRRGLGRPDQQARSTRHGEIYPLETVPSGTRDGWNVTDVRCPRHAACSRQRQNQAERAQHFHRSTKVGATVAARQTKIEGRPRKPSLFSVPRRVPQSSEAGAE